MWFPQKWRGLESTIKSYVRSSACATANLHEISGLEVTVAVGSEDPDVELDDAPG